MFFLSPSSSCKRILTISYKLDTKTLYNWLMEESLSSFKFLCGTKCCNFIEIIIVFLWREENEIRYWLFFCLVSWFVIELKSKSNDLDHRNNTETHCSSMDSCDGSAAPEILSTNEVHEVPWFGAYLSNLCTFTLLNCLQLTTTTTITTMILIIIIIIFLNK